jgi:hypothetical protein
MIRLEEAHVREHSTVRTWYVTVYALAASTSRCALARARHGRAQA